MLGPGPLLKCICIPLPVLKVCACCRTNIHIPSKMPLPHLTITTWHTPVWIPMFSETTTTRSWVQLTQREATHITQSNTRFASYFTLPLAFSVHYVIISVHSPGNGNRLDQVLNVPEVFVCLATWRATVRTIPSIVFDHLYCSVLSGCGIVPHCRVPSTELILLHDPIRQKTDAYSS